MKKIAIVCLTLSLLVVNAFAQVNNGLLTTLSAVAGQRDRMPIEKLYLQLDKPYYALGDTLRFKAFLLNGDLLKPSKRSGLLYVELADALNKVVKRITVRAVNGISVGDIALKGKDIPQGTYTLRAYSNWMKNFGNDHIFKKSLYFSAVNGSTTLVKTDFKLENGKDKDKVTANISFTGLDGRPRQQQELRLTIKQNDKILFRQNANTGTDGIIQLNFDVAAKASIKNVIIQAQNITKGADTTELTIPITINRPENTDLQLMPEGGNMVAGIPTKIGFKAINDDGNGIAISGKIVNSKQQEVATFQSTHKGMGSFELTPQTGENYTAKALLPNGTIKDYPLPTVNPTGTALRITPKGKDSLEVTINATPDLLTATAPIAIGATLNYYLIGQTRGMICYSSIINFKGTAIKKAISTDLFPTGIAHFTLLSSVNQPLNERIVYIDHDDNLQMHIAPDKPGYTLRDHIGLGLQVTDKTGKPIRGNFSIAVTDDSQVNIDSLGNNILTSLLLTSDLQGTVEEPGWYFNEKNAERGAALDNLLLTQGWVGYDWKEIFAPPVSPEYEAEPEFKVKGRVNNIFNKPLVNTEVMLISTKPELLLNTKTDENGRFAFSNFPPLDTINFRLQTRRESNVGLTVDEFVPPELTLAKDIPAPWYVNTDSTRLSYAHNKKMEWDETFDARNTILLKQVEIRAKQPVHLAFDEPLLQLNEEEIRNARPGKKPFTVHDLLNQQQNLSQMKLMLLVDGNVATHFDASNMIQAGVKYDYMERSNMPTDGSAEAMGLLDRLTTENIKSLSAKKILVPVIITIPGTNPPVIIKGTKLTYLQINVTTNAKFGDRAIPAGEYVYRPMPISWPHKFYSPKYAVNTPVTGKDRRSTIFWEPNLITDASGKADLSFYSADLPGTYSVIIEGTDMNGNFGYSRQKIKVGKK